MFESLTERLGRTIKNLSGSGRLTDSNIEDALREVRRALLEADVALPVITTFLERVQQRAIGQEVMSGLRPGEALIGVVKDELTAILGGENSGLNFNTVPPAVVLPHNRIALEAVLSLCHEQLVPMVIRGAGTGLSGGATPLANGLLISLAKFNRILEIDASGFKARVEPGVTNLAISQAVEGLGLFYAPDPSSQIACSIGGNVAENSGGVHCLKYGLTLHNVCGLKVPVTGQNANCRTN